MKTGSTVSLSQVRDYLKEGLIIYQLLIEKLMYQACGMRQDIIFVVR